MELLIFILGIITAGIGYMLANFVFKPVQDFLKMKAEVGYRLTCYVNIITSPMNVKIADEAEPILRDLACDLERKYLLVPMPRLFSALGVLPTADEIMAARGQLFFLSSSLHDDGHNNSRDNRKALEAAFTSLNIKELSKMHNQK